MPVQQRCAKCAKVITAEKPCGCAPAEAPSADPAPPAPALVDVATPTDSFTVEVKKADET